MNRVVPAKLVCCILLSMVAALTGGCGSADANNGTEGLRVVATTTMIGDLVKRIGGDRVDLSVLMGPGVDPHTYKPSTGDVATLVRARVIFFNGLHLEGKMLDLLEGRYRGKSIAVTRDIPEDRLLAWKEGQSGAHDPHVWFDVTLWMSAAQTIADGLSKADPAGAAEYARRLEAVKSQMQKLHGELLARATALPAGKRVLITSHDAFSYFGKAYGFEVFGLQGISTETEVRRRDIDRAAEFILARKVPAIFVESSVPRQTIERLLADCRQRIAMDPSLAGLEVQIGGELYSDAMGSPGEHPGYAVETYEGMMRYNMDTLVNSLGKGR